MATHKPNHVDTLAGVTAPQSDSTSQPSTLTKPDQNVVDAWRREMDAVVIQAARDAKDYPSDILDIVKNELERRGLRADSPQDAVRLYPSLYYLADRLISVDSWRMRHRTAILVAWLTIMAVWTFLFYGYPIEDDNNMLRVVILSTAYFIAAVVLCWPLTEYRLVLRINTIACILWYVFAAINSLTGGSYNYVRKLNLLLWMVVMVGGSWAGYTVLLLSIVAIRRKVWPVYPPGHCTACGYNLWGLIEPRCPECGTTFEPPPAKVRAS